MQIRSSSNASRLPQLPTSFSTALTSFGSVTPLFSSGSASSSTLPLSFVKADLGFPNARAAYSASSLRQPSLFLTRSSLRSIRQVQTDVSRNSNNLRRFSTTSSLSKIPSASYFTSFPLHSSSASSEVNFSAVERSVFFPLRRLAFTRNSLRRFFNRRRSFDLSAQRFRHSPILIDPNANEDILSASTQSVKTVETTRYANNWAVGFSRPTYAIVSSTLGLLTGSPVHLTRVSALSVARFAHDRETLLYSATQRASRLGTATSPFSSAPFYSLTTPSVGFPNSSPTKTVEGLASPLSNFLRNRYRFTFRAESSRLLSNRPLSVAASCSGIFSSFAISTALSDSRGSSTRRQSGPPSIVLPRLTSAALLRTLERSRGRFQRTAVHLPDLLRLGFVARYFKKADLLAALFSWALAALPRTRKETLFVRFLIKLLKVLATQRPERLGLRIRFKGRVNRWRRTKQILGSKGSVPLYTYNARLEVGDSQAITRKGTLGIRVWLAYNPRFSTALRSTLFTYVRGSASSTTSPYFSELSLSPSPLSASFNPAQYSSQFDTASDLYPSPRTPLARPTL